MRQATASSRRRWLQATARWGGAGLLGAAPWPLAWAGAQKEEHLADSVRTALSASVRMSSAPPVPFFDNRQQEQDYLRWLGEMQRRLGNRMENDFTRREFLQTVWYEAARAGLEVSLVLGLIQVESNFRKFAISPVGARGLMQVMPFWKNHIGRAEHNLFDIRTNLRYGCTILRHYNNVERGNLTRALARFNGSLGSNKYPNAVIGAWRNRWQWAG